MGGEFAAGAIQDGAMTSGEGSLCVAYPLAVIARQRRDADLESLAIEQIRLRRGLLVTEDGSIWLRNRNGQHSMQNWARGIAWYFLGLVRVLIELGDRDDLDDLRVEADRVAEFVTGMQRADGLWANETHRADVAPDTSGSAGIAAALAWGAVHRILPDRSLEVAKRTRSGLEPYLTPDGLLAGGTPSNRSEEGLSERRVIFQVGMGLTAQLLAAIAAAEEDRTNAE